MKTLEDQPKAMKAKRNRSERAQTTAEFVIVFPFMLLFLFLIIDFGWLLKNWLVVTNSAREAARCTVANRCTDDDPVALAISRVLDGGVVTASEVATLLKAKVFYVDSDNNNIASAGEGVVVCVQAKSKFISPLIPFLDWLVGGGILDADGDRAMPLAAREEMILEDTSHYSLTKITAADTINTQGKCRFS